MKKIASLFQRNYDGDHKVRDEVVEGSEWVINGEGSATRKWDGTCCLIRDGKLLKRYEVKKGKTPPVNFEPANDIDPNTGKQQGWVPVIDGPEDRWHREAFDSSLEDGTYELIGPKVQGNPDMVEDHKLVPHGKEILKDVPLDYEGIRKYLSSLSIEGIVWHHPDGRMVKIKKRDFPKL